ncbi:MAG TPA: hypothetical protein VGL33_33905 [Streptosporangiaceae bacterium]
MRNAASLVQAGRPLRDPPRQPASEHCRVKEAAAQVDKARAREQAAEQRAAERDKSRKGPGPVRNITDPDSRLMPVHGGGFGQCCNTENVVSGAPGPAPGRRPRRAPAGQNQFRNSP